MKNLINSNLVIYESNEGEIKINVSIEDETVWLSLNQMAEIFARDKSVISKHLKNIFKNGELDKNSTVAFFATVQKEGEKVVKRQIEYYNLDVILSVGYRVNSKQGTQFRKWASNILREYLIKGYSLNQDKLLEGKINELQSAIDLISNTLENNKLITNVGEGILDIIKAYSKTWDLLIKYDEEKISFPANVHHSQQEIISYEFAKNAIANFKAELEVEGLFGIERENAFKAILGNIMQSFGGEDLYKSSEEKASHLLYFIIKDHPFSDGNKRIGSFLFLLYLKISYLNSTKMNENTLTALALLVAESKPTHKNLVIKLIMNLIN